MNMNKFLTFAILLGSFALQAETTYYKQTGSLLKPNWVRVSADEFNRNQQQQNMVYGGCQMPRSPYINDNLQCTSCDYVYASCTPATPNPMQQKPITFGPPQWFLDRDF